MKKGHKKKNKNINVTEVKILDKKQEDVKLKKIEKEKSEESNVIEEVNGDDFKLNEEIYDTMDNKKKNKKKKK